VHDQLATALTEVALTVIDTDSFPLKKSFAPKSRRKSELPSPQSLSTGSLSFDLDLLLSCRNFLNLQLSIFSAWKQKLSKLKTGPPSNSIPDELLFRKEGRDLTLTD
jgi:hypothetical protein